MKIFVTGGSGFIGSHFINHAMEAGHELVCLRRKHSQPRVRLKAEPIWVEGNLEDQLNSWFAGCDALVHLAAHSTNYPYDTLENCLYWNLTAPLRFMNRAREAGIERFLVAGTGFEYGRSGERYDRIPVNAPLEPTVAYAASKAASSIAFAQWSIEYKLQLQYLRFFQVFGDGEDDDRLWPSLRKAAEAGEDFNLTKGQQVRDFVPVEKVAIKILEALDFEEVEDGVPSVRNIGSGQHTTLKQFVEYWWNTWGAAGTLNFGSVPYRKDEVMTFVPLLSPKDRIS